MPTTRSSSRGPAPTWTLVGAAADARVAGLDVRLDLAAPAAGLVIAGDHLLGIDLHGDARPPVERWVRGTDLTAIYEPDDPRRLRATAMWRPWPGPIAAWELVVSAQTSLWHADAGITVVCESAPGDAAWAAPTAARWHPIRGAGPLPPEASIVLVRRAQTAIMLAIHPQDQRHLEVQPAGGRLRIVCGLFPTTVEKGVILRSRALAGVGPAAGAESWAAELVAAFAASPPFLDT